ncbi:MAG: hypothetical protein L7F78_19500, partial [Syntrophales bacterium LBB04]|nr:hypothetical protein [Syntrophales bacterium LBB04]
MIRLRWLCQMARGSFFWGLVFLAILGTASLAGANNLIYNGDFEVPASKNPPPGWVMWGPAANQDPSYYSLDPTSPQSGKYCFRIHHPAGSAGYIVTDPAQALKPRKGKIYTISFYARTSKPGRSLFGFAAYETLNPFKDAPSPGSFPIDVQSQWKQFTFEIKEGMDFFADRSRFLLLAFHAATDAQEEKTLWIDAVAVTEKDFPQGVRLIDERTLP